MSQCPMCFSTMAGDECPTCGYSGEAAVIEIPTVKGAVPETPTGETPTGETSTEEMPGAQPTDASVAAGDRPTSEQALVLRAMARTLGGNLVGVERFGVAIAAELEVPLDTVRELEKAGWIAPAGRLQGATGWRLTRAGQVWAMSRAQLDMLQGMQVGKVFLDKGSVAGGHFDGESNRRYPFHEIALALGLAWIEPVAGSVQLDDAGRVRKRELAATAVGLAALEANEAVGGSYSTAR